MKEKDDCRFSKIETVNNTVRDKTRLKLEADR